MAGLEDLTPEQRAQLNLAQLLLSDPETSKQARRLAKKLKPELQFADLDMDDQIKRRDEANAERVKALEEQIRKDKFDREREKAHARMRERNLDPVAVEKVMTENGIANYDLAAEVLEARSAAAAPTPDDLSPMTLPKGAEGGADLWKDPKGFATNTAYAVLNAFRRQKVAGA
jgi:hypothetical protein